MALSLFFSFQMHFAHASIIHIQNLKAMGLRDTLMSWVEIMLQGIYFRSGLKLDLHLRPSQKTSLIAGCKEILNVQQNNLEK